MKTDSFGSFYYKENSNFQFFGHRSFFDTSKNLFRESAFAGYNMPFQEGNYLLEVSSGNENHVYTTGTDLTGAPTLYFYPDFWAGDNPDFAVRMWKAGGADVVWKKLINSEVVNGKTIYSFDMTDYVSDYVGFQFTRMVPGTAENDYAFGNPPCYNSTGDLAVSDLVARPYNAVKITDWGSCSYWHFYNL